MRRLSLCAAIVLAVCAALLSPIHGENVRVFLSGSGSTIVLAHGNTLYRPSGADQMEKMAYVSRPAITAMTAGADGVFTAVGRMLYAANLDGTSLRFMCAVRAESITALADFDGKLYAAAGGNIYVVPVQGGATPALYAHVPGSIHALYAAADGVYAAVGKTLWRVNGTQRDRIADAPSPIFGISGGNRNVYYAYRAGSSVEISAPGATQRWSISGLKQIDAIYYDPIRHTLHYSWSDKSGPHFQDLGLGPV